MADSLELSDLIPASPDRIYRAWLDSTEHGAMTGGSAISDENIGGSFNIMDGYISGTNLELEPGRRIVQAWRTTDFPEGHPDSRLEIELVSDGDGTRIILRHTEIPAGQGADYEEGWRKYYFDPMRKYFSGAADESESTEAETTRMPAIAMPPAEGWEPEEEEPREDDVSRPAKKAAKKPAKKAAAKAKPAKKAAKKPAKAVKKSAKPAKKAAKKPKKPAKAAKKKPAKKAAKKAAKKPAKKKGKR